MDSLALMSVGLLLAGPLDHDIPDTHSLTEVAPDPVPILGGQVAGTCDWPSSVLMSGCSGTLIHPEIVIYAAHCGNTNTVGFGVEGEGRSASTEYCRDSPRYPEEGWDIAYCKLAQPVTDVPIAPILMGCELDQLQVGTEVWMASFGRSSNSGGGFGTKRFVRGEIAGFPSGGKKIGLFYADSDTGTCSGDSGGSNFVRLADGTWRAFGITVTHAGGNCGGSSQSTRMWAAVPWIEEDSGIDISPCHDADGAWNPGPDCGGFPETLEDGGGLSWAEGCGPGSVGGISGNCGPTEDEEPDTVPPSIEIVTPVDGEYEGPTYRTPIEITAGDDWGVLDVTVSIGDMEIAVLTAEPYTVGNVDLPEGTHQVTAVARDWSGNVTDAVPVQLVVGDEGPGATSGTPPDETSGTGDPPEGDSDAPPPDGGDSDGADSDGEGPSGTDPEGSEGCGCRSQGSPDGMGPFALLGMLAFSRVRRRARP